jgi:Zn-dependent M28 family amino/carboxypeptidase
VLFWSLAVLLPILGARMAGLEGSALSVLQLPPTLVLLVAAFALVDIQLSAVVPGANDNASGVATAISVASRLDRDPPANLDVWVLLTGAEECLQEGMRGFVRSHRRTLEQGRTYFLCLDTVGHGFVRFETLAGWVVSYPMDRRLVELCEALAESDRDADRRFGAEPLRHGGAGDSLPPRLAGFPAIGITCRNEHGVVPHLHQPTDTPERVDPDALERAHAFTLELVRLLDRDLGRSGTRR